jgi:hypothetical protein
MERSGAGLRTQDSFRTALMYCTCLSAAANPLSPAVRRLVNDLHSRKGWCEEDDIVQCHDHGGCGRIIGLHGSNSIGRSYN